MGSSPISVLPLATDLQPLFNRTIKITRPGKVSVIGGTTTYGGVLKATETVVLTGLPASIQFQPKRDRPLGQLPADASTIAQWHIYVPPGFATAGQIVERDVVTDDLGRRFAIFASWPLDTGGWMFGTEMLET